MPGGRNRDVSTSVSGVAREYKMSEIKEAIHTYPIYYEVICNFAVGDVSASNIMTSSQVQKLNIELPEEHNQRFFSQSHRINFGIGKPSNEYPTFV